MLLKEQDTLDRHQDTALNGGKVSRLATWNVRTFENVKKEMKRLNIDIMGLSEVRWTQVFLDQVT